MHNSIAIGKKNVLEGMEKSEAFTKKKFKSELNKRRQRMLHHRPKRQSLYYIFHLILNQKKLTYNTCYALQYVFRCFICRKTKSLRTLKGAKKDYELDLGIDMLARDLDVVSFLQLTKDYHLIKQVLFNQDDQFLTQLQHRDMICTSTSED